MAERIRFGVLGTGNIAHQFAQGVADSSRCEVTAVGSRRDRSAHAFAKQFNLERAYGSYEALLADESVDAVYVSLPNSMHHQWTVRALTAGKHVLCEKPIADDAAQAAEMFDTAKKRGLMLIEAFMYRSHPLTRAVLAEVRRGVIGEVKLIRASFCYHTNKIEGNVRFSPELTGGALMDVGCYCVDLARLITGADPTTIQCAGKRHETGVDEYACGLLGYDGGVVATFCCGITVQTDNTALICGDRGYIRVPIPWKPPEAGACYEVDTMTPPKQDQSRTVRPGKRVVEVSTSGTLYGLEADDFAAAVLDGAPPAISEDDSLANMRVLDELRQRMV
jgi:xylose dehydrogenase (NAD/NADP)